MEHTPMHRVAAASAIGTILEWYDFALYNAMSGLVFNKIFFPSFDPLVGTLLAFLTYGVGMVARPVGGIICGRLGDLIGRRPMLIATVSIMGTSTALIGLLPSYGQVGVLAPMLLVLLRFVQGIMLGGEWAGAVLLAVAGGAGRQRGGLGVCRDYRIIGDGIVLATRSSRQKFPAQGLGGGRSGGLGAFILDADQPTATKRLPGTGSEIQLRKGALLRIITAGGGGYGDPQERDPAKAAADRRSEKSIS